MPLDGGQACRRTLQLQLRVQIPASRTAPDPNAPAAYTKAIRDHNSCDPLFFPFAASCRTCGIYTAVQLEIWALKPMDGPAQKRRKSATVRGVPRPY